MSGTVPKIDIEEAIHAHGAWKAKFRSFLYGKAGLDVATVGTTKACSLGQWLQHEGQRLLPAADHERISQTHAEFHRVAQEIVTKILQRDFAAARQDLVNDGAFDQASHALTEALRKASLHALPAARPVPKPQASTDPGKQD
jgi:hypothetical protein